MDIIFSNIFREITYPTPVETIADNHPVYVNGTKLINGKPMITDKTKDFSRIEEFKKLGFSREYIQELTDSQICSYYFQGSKGTKINYGTSLPYKPSYSKIGNETILSDPIRDLKHKILIEKDSVFFNNHCIAIAPEKHNNGKKFTSAQKTTFLRAVVFGIIPTEINKYQKDTNGKMIIVSVPDDLYFRELIAKYPAVLDNQDSDVKTVMMDEMVISSAPEEIVLPELLNAYTPEAITGYPNTEEILKGKTFHLKTPSEIIELSEMEERSIKNDEYDNYYSSVDHAKTEIIQLYDLLSSETIVQKWTIPHLRLSIIEEGVPA